MDFTKDVLDLCDREIDEQTRIIEQRTPAEGQAALALEKAHFIKGMTMIAESDRKFREILAALDEPPKNSENHTAAAVNMLGLVQAHYDFSYHLAGVFKKR